MLRACVIVLSLVLLLDVVSGQKFFREVIPLTATWSPRDKANVEFVTKSSVFRDGLRNGASTQLTNYFLLYGGDTGRGWVNDVWASVGGRNWVWVAGVTETGEEHPNFPDTFPPYQEAAHCQDSTFRQYRAGGHQSGTVYNDVWTSSNGWIWSAATTAAEFEPVYLANMVTDASNAVYIAGGILDLVGNPRRSTGSVWRSINQGRTWREMTSGYDINGQQIGGGPRAVSILLNYGTNLIWMTGVNTGLRVGDIPESYRRDVWLSTNQGTSWDPLTLNVPYGSRDDSNAEVASNGLIVMAGGYGGTGPSITGNYGEIYNDVWVSANGGYSWGLCVLDAEWDDRRYQMTLLDDKGFLWVMGGRGSGNGEPRFGDMWISQISYADMSAVTSQCRVTAPSCGIGLKCLPKSGNTLVAADGNGVYCDVCPYTFSGQQAVTTTIIAFLVVFIVLTIVAFLALGYTYYKLRSAGAPSPIPLPATAQRWWNKPTTGVVGGTTDSGSTANGDGLYQPLRIRDQV